MELGEFHDAFFDECRDHLDDMEITLLKLTLPTPTQEDINTLFRCAHSIKGGAGMFGLAPISDLTHAMETLFDGIRKQQQSLSKEAVSLLLRCIDEVREVIKTYQSDDEITPLTDLKLINQVNGLIKPCDEFEEFSLFEPITPASQDEFSFFEPIENQANHVEVDDAKPVTSARKKKTVSTLRVKTEKVDSVMNQLGELVISQSVLRNLSQHAVGPQAEAFEEALDTLSQQLRELQASVMSIRMLPVDELFDRFNRVVHDVAETANKQVNLELKGLHTELDKTMIERLIDPLTHLIRNAIDHGIELPSRRLENAKEPTGTITLSAYQQGSVVTITIQDDGAGLDREKILHRARERNINIADNAPDETVWNLIFAPGFSTADSVTELSGRGVGMDVVKRNIEGLGGSISMISRAGQGTTVTLVLPLTLAILDGMLVAVDEHTYIVPLLNIVESFQVELATFKRINNRVVVFNRGLYWPVITLSESRSVSTAIEQPKDDIIVLLKTATSRVALLVDGLLGDQQVVIKSLEKHYKSVANVAAATILGNGKVGLILDVEQLSSLTSAADNTEKDAHCDE